MVAEMWWFNGFQNVSCPPSWIFEIQFLTFWEAKRPILLHHTKFCKDRSNRCGDIAIFVIFTMAAAAILDFQRFNNGRSAERGQYASPCRISSKSVTRLQRYGNLTVFKMAGVRHLGFVKFQYFNDLSGWQNPFCVSVPNFVKIGQTVAKISQFLWFSRWRLPAAWIFKSSKL